MSSTGYGGYDDGHGQDGSWQEEGRPEDDYARDAFPARDGGSAGGLGAAAPGRSAVFRPGPGLVIAVVAVIAVVVLGLGAAVAGALGASGTSNVLGGLALVIVGVGLLALLRVPARALVVNAPRLRLARLRARAARAARAREDTEAAGHPQSSSTSRTLGTDLLLPADSGARELTTLDVVSGPLTTMAASSRAGRWADEKLAGTTTGEALARVLQLLAGALGFLLLALGLAAVLGQVLS